MQIGLLLAVLFIGLKMAHVIAWSWLWVLSPIWIEAILSVLIFFGIIVVAYIWAKKD